MSRIRISGFLAALCFPFILAAQKKTVTQPIVLTDAKLPELFDRYIQNARLLWKTPGLSVVVVKDGHVVFKKAFGVANIQTQVPYSTLTLSTCASTTKAMTAMCMGMLIDEGLVKWNDGVGDILPEFKLFDPYATAEIKIKDLFTHNTGLGNADLLWVFGYSREEIVHRMQYVPPAYSLRSSYIYQNLMYLVAGEVIKKVTGKTWNDFITERIFKPLGMNNTFSNYATIPAGAPKTTPHFKDRDNHDTITTIAYLGEDNIGAAGGVWSCADDMGKWLQFLLDSTQLNGKRLLKPETFAELFKPQVIVPANQFYPTIQVTHPHWLTYGLGWFQHDYRGKMVNFHTGSLDGLVAIAGMIPDDHLAIYIFGNLDHSEIRHALMYKAFDLWAFHDNRNDWGTDLLKLYTGLTDTARKREDEQLAKRVMNTKPSLLLTAYTGKFSSDLYGKAEIVLLNDSLQLQLPDHISLSLHHWNYDTFRGYFNNWWFGKSFVQFNINTEGTVSGFSIDGILYNKENPK